MYRNQTEDDLKQYLANMGKGSTDQTHGPVAKARTFNRRGSDPTSKNRETSPYPTKTFHLHGQLPSGKNAVKITRTGKRYPDKRFVNWRADALEQIGGVAGPFVGPVSMTVQYAPGNLIKRDVPGMLDALCHLIEKAGIVLDDCQVVNVSWEQMPLNRKSPSAFVTLEEVTS